MVGHKVNSRGQASDLCWHTVLVCRIIETKNLQSAECLPTYYCELSVKAALTQNHSVLQTFVYNDPVWRDAEFYLDFLVNTQMRFAWNYQQCGGAHGMQASVAEELKTAPVTIVTHSNGLVPTDAWRGGEAWHTSGG